MPDTTRRDSLSVLRSQLLRTGAQDLLPGGHFNILLAERYLKWEHDAGGWWWTGPNRKSVLGLNTSLEDYEKVKRGELKNWDREWLPEFTTDVRSALRLLDHWPGDYQVARHNGLFRVKLFEPSREHEQWADTLELAIGRAALASTI